MNKKLVKVLFLLSILSLLGCVRLIYSDPSEPEPTPDVDNGGENDNNDPDGDNDNTGGDGEDTGGDNNNPDEDKDDEVITEEIVITTSEISLNMTDDKLTVDNVINYVEIKGDYDVIAIDTTKVDYNNAGAYDFVVQANEISKEIKLLLFDDLNVPVITSEDIEFDITDPDIETGDVYKYVTISNNNTGITEISWDLTSVDFDTLGENSINVEILYGNNKISQQVIKLYVVDFSTPIILTKSFERNMSDSALTLTDVDTFINVGGNVSIVDSVSWELTNVDYNSAGTYFIKVTVTYNQTETIEKDVELTIYDDVNLPVVDTTKVIRDINDGEISESDIGHYITITDSNTGITSYSWNLTNVDFNAAGVYNIEVTITYGNSQHFTETIEIEIISDEAAQIGNDYVYYVTGTPLSSVDWVKELSITDDYTRPEDLIVTIRGLEYVNLDIQHKDVLSYDIYVEDSYGNSSYRRGYLDFISKGYTDDYIYEELDKSVIRVTLVNQQGQTAMGSGTIIDYEKATNEMVISTNAHVISSSASWIVKIEHNIGKPTTASYLPTLCAEIKVDYQLYTDKPDIAILEVVGEMDSNYGNNCQSYNPVDLSLYEDRFRVLPLMADDLYVENVEKTDMRFYTKGYPLGYMGYGKSEYYGHWYNTATNPSDMKYMFTRMDVTGYVNNSGASGSLVVDSNLNLIGMHVGSISGSTTGHSIIIMNDSIKVAYKDYCDLNLSYATKEMCKIV